MHNMAHKLEMSMQMCSKILKFDDSLILPDSMTMKLYITNAHKAEKFLHASHKLIDSKG